MTTKRDGVLLAKEILSVLLAALMLLVFLL